MDELFLVCEQAGEGATGGGGGAASTGAAGGDASPGASAPAGGAPAGDGGGAAKAAPSGMDRIKAAAAGAKVASAPAVETPAGAALQKTPEQLAAEAAAAKYAPKLKYKVLKEEKDFPEWAKPLATSEEMENTLKDIFERADGLAEVKEHRDRLIQEHTRITEEWGPFVADAQKALGHLRRGDMDSFFEATGVSELQILKHAQKILALRADPNAAAAHNQQRQLQLDNQRLQEEASQYQNGYQTLATQQKDFEISVALGRPEILSTVQAFDAKVGKPGAFRAEVIRRGQSYVAMGQPNVSTDQVVTEVLQLLGWQGQTQGQNPQPPVTSVQNGAGASAADQNGGAGTPAQQTPPTLPNLRGKGGSPVKKAFRSTDEIRKYAKSLR